MDFDKDFYKKWKTKAMGNRQLFFDDSDLSKIETDKIFSSTALEEQSKSETEFSLRLSESYIDETQESADTNKPKQNQHEVIMISDSSPDSVLSNSKQCQSKTKSLKVQALRGVQVLESSEDEDCIRNSEHQVVVRNIAKSNSDSRSSKSKVSGKPVVIEESDLEDDDSAMQQIVKETVAESVTLSERKKKEILNWLETNFDNMLRCGSSCSQDSAVSDSRKSDMSSGNSSLERLEMNFETPNNRGKLSKPGTVGSSSKKLERDYERQSRLDEFFKKSSKGQLNIIRDRTIKSKNSDDTPTNFINFKPRRIIADKTPGSKTSDQTPITVTKSNLKSVVKDKTPGSKCSDKTPVNITRSNLKLVTQDKTPGSKCSDKTPVHITKSNLKSVTRDKTPGSKCSDKTPVNITRSNLKVVIQDKTPGSKCSDKTPVNISKSNLKKTIYDKTPGSIYSDKTPGSKYSEKTPINSVKSNKTKTAVKTPGSKCSDKSAINSNTKPIVKKIVTKTMSDSKVSNKTPISLIQNSKKTLIPETQTSDIVDSSEELSITNIQPNQNKVIIPESESFESKESSDIFEKLNNSGSDKFLKNKSKKPSRKIPDFFEMTDDLDISNRPSDINLKNTGNQVDHFINNKITTDTNIFNKLGNGDNADLLEKLNNKNIKNKFIDNKGLKGRSELLPGCLEITDDIESLSLSNDKNSENKIDDQVEEPAVHNTTVNTTINDCADILGNLYGEAWRNKAKTLISATEPRKHTKKIIKGIQTEKKITFRKPKFNLELDNELSDKENDCEIQEKRPTTSKKVLKKNNVKDSFINDDSTTESSPDCSYYTAVSNPLPSSNILPQTKTTSTVQINDKNKNTVIAICDSESDDDIVNDDNDNWKIRDRTQRKLSYDSSSSSITSEFDPDDIVPPKTKIKSVKPKKLANFEAFTKSKTVQQSEKQVFKKSFLASLSKDVPLEEADFRAMTFRTKYNTLKEQLCKELFKLFNEKVFDNKLPEDLAIEWSVRLRGTAGKCYNKQSVKALGTTVRSSRIVLATKILDSPDRLRDTLIHEMCHAATWLVNNVSDGHGSFWKAWAHKATKVFPELPQISRCHNYEIQTKYTYKCTTCGYSVGRHSKSLDLDRKRCGYCHGKFELLINKMTKAGKVQKKSTAQTRTPSGFALYVKENYQLVKQSGAAVKHGEVMKILGQQFSSIKLTPKPNNICDNDKSS